MKEKYGVCDCCQRWAIVKDIQESEPGTVNRWKPVRRSWCAECRRKNAGRFRLWR